MNARAMLSLLLHGDKALDVVRTAPKIGDPNTRCRAGHAP